MALLEVISEKVVSASGLSQYEEIWYVFPVFIIMLILWSILNFFKSLAKKPSKVQDQIDVGVKKITQNVKKHDKVLAKNTNEDDENVSKKSVTNDENTEEIKITSDLKTGTDKDVRGQLNFVENNLDQTKAVHSARESQMPKIKLQN